MVSPLHRHSRSGSSNLSNMKRAQNAKAAAQRLAKVIFHQPADNEQEEDDLLIDLEPAGPSASIGLGLAGQNKNRPPVTVRKPVEQPLPLRPAIGPRASAASSVEHHRSISSVRTPAAANSLDQKPLSAHAASSLRSSQSNPAEPSPSPHPSITGPSSQLLDSTEEEQPSIHPTSSARASAALNWQKQPSSARSAPFLQSSQSKLAEPRPSLHSSVAGHSSQMLDFAEEAQPPSARSNAFGRSTSNANSSEQPLYARSIGRPSLRVKTAASGPTIVPLPNKPAPSETLEAQHKRNLDKKLSLDLGTFKHKEPPGGQHSSSALQDELDMLQEENESLLEKLRISEERHDEAESRIRQLEKQIASLGEGVSLEARLLSRKEAQLEKREAALRAVSIKYGGEGDEVEALRMEVEAVREEANSLRTMAQRMILTQDEMEEVVLKRCWLARCWSLCVHHGVQTDIAEARNEYWSAYASRPVEVILAAGRKAKDQNSSAIDLDERDRVIEDKDEVSKRATVEHMLLVEKGLRELNLLKVEEAITLSMAQQRRQSMIKSNVTEELKLPSEGYDFPEAFELSQEEAEDVYCKQALLMYFWRRAKTLDLEPDIADDRLEYWIKQGDKPPNSHDAVDVERGLLELRKLGIETKLWEESRRLIDPDNAEKTLLETEYQILD